MTARCLRWTAWTGVIFLVACGLAVTAQTPSAAVAVYDTGASSSTPLPGSAVAAKAGWTPLPEDETAHAFKGDTVVANDRVAVLFRRGGPGAELYAVGAQGPVLRAVLAPVTGKAAAQLASVTLVENSTGEAIVDAAFRASEGPQAVVRFELPGQAFIKSEARGSAARLRVESPCRFAVLPDFFADDITVDAAELPLDRAELPSENFFLHMVGGGDAIVAAIWNQREEDIQVTLAGQGKARVIQASEIPYGAKGSVSVAVLEGPQIWHTHDVAKADADRIIPLTWKAPFPAVWRMDWRQDDGLIDSWEMLVEQSDGTFAKVDWFGQSDRYGTPDWMHEGRHRWNTVLSDFQYPCWIDKDGRGFIQPLKKPGKSQGPTVLYPINRVAATPLTTLTFVDLVRSILGVGPCEYVLDVEGQHKKAEGIPTCATKDKLDAIYAAKQQKLKRAEVDQALVDVLAFVRHIRNRIEAYVVFGHEMLAYLAEHKKAHPEQAGLLSELEAITKRIDASLARRKDMIQTPEDATKLEQAFRATVFDYEGDDALARCQKITAGFVQIGGHQDHLVGECRVAVKILRQKAALAMATDPNAAVVAKEIRRRTQAMLRNPVGYEAPRM